MRTTSRIVLTVCASIRLSPLSLPIVVMPWIEKTKNVASRSAFARPILDGSYDCDNTYGAKCTTPVSGASGGTVKQFRWTIPQDEYEDGYHGASVWCTAAFDPESRSLFACGGNPHSEGLESRYSNALLKIDFDPNSETFGDIVDHYKGTRDQYVGGLERQTVCDEFGEETRLLVWSVGCLMLDLDFGASPNLFYDDFGRLMVGDLQKAGVYHAAYADHMSPAWSQQVSIPCFACNATSGAYANGKVFTVGSFPGQVVAVGTDKGQAGRPQWAGVIGDQIHYQSVSTANGVVYVTDGAGFLNMFDAERGLPLMRRPLGVDAGGATASFASQGVAIARNQIYAAADSYVVVLGL